MASPVIQFKRGAFANLPGLQAGEPALTTDTFELYVGIDSTTNNNKFFGSHRYWTRESSSTGSAVNLVEGTSNGSNYISLKAPDSLGNTITYTLPGTDGTSNQVLATNGSGTLSFIDAIVNLNLAGDDGTDTVDLLTDTFSIIGTASEIITAVTNNQVQIGLPDNVVIGAALTVTTALDVNGGADISGGETTLSSATISDLTSGRIVIAGASGALEDSGNLTFDGSTLTVTGEIVVNSGVSTFSGLIDVNGDIDVAGHSELDNVNVSGIITATSVVFGSGTAITSVDTDLSAVSASDDTLASAKAIKTYVDTQITAQDLDIQADTGGALSIDLDSETLTISGTSNEIETSGAGNTITIGLPDNVIIGAGLTVTGALDVNGGGTIDNIQIGVTGDNEIDTTSGNLTIDSAGGTVTIDDELIVSGDVRINGNDIKSSDGSTAITMSSTNVTVGGDLTVGGNDIKASDGTTALTLANSTGAVTTANDLTVSGNLYVSGNTTQVNTAALTVEDRTIDLGVVNGAVPASATTWDLGILFNYNSSGAKKSAVIWEHGDTRFKFASILSSDTNGSNNDTPQLTVTTFAPIEIGALWVTDCAGTSQVISCTGSTRYLENITIDAGTF
jgi:hypothetical protein